MTLQYILKLFKVSEVESGGGAVSLTWVPFSWTQDSLYGPRGPSAGSSGITSSHSKIRPEAVGMAWRFWGALVGAVAKGRKSVGCLPFPPPSTHTNPGLNSSESRG